MGSCGTDARVVSMIEAAARAWSRGHAMCSRSDMYSRGSSGGSSRGGGLGSVSATAAAAAAGRGRQARGQESERVSGHGRERGALVRGSAARRRGDADGAGDGPTYGGARDEKRAHTHTQ